MGKRNAKAPASWAHLLDVESSPVDLGPRLKMPETGPSIQSQESESTMHGEIRPVTRAHDDDYDSENILLDDGGEIFLDDDVDNVLR